MIALPSRKKMLNGISDSRRLVLITAVESLTARLLVPAQYLPTTSFSVLYISLLFCQTSIYWLYWIFIYPFCLSPLRSLPQAKGGKFLIGNAMAIYEQPAGHTFLRWMENIPNDGMIYFRGLLYQDRLFVTNPKVLSEVLVTSTYDFQKPKILRDFLRLFLGDGLIVVEDQEHDFQRKHIMPAFSFRVVKGMYPVFWKKAMQLVDVVTHRLINNTTHQSINQAEMSSVVEIGEWASQASLDIIGIAIGRDFQTLANSQDPFIVNYKELTKPTVENQLYFLCNMLFSPSFVSTWPWRLNRRNKNLLGNISTIGLDLVRDKTKELQGMEQEADYKDILSMLIQSQNFTTPQMVDHILTFLAAGHETTWSTFTWITYLLAKHPDIQSDLRAEIIDWLRPTKSGTFAGLDFAATDTLPLLNGVCNETLRLYPAIPVTVRNVVRPTRLAGHYIPAGTQVVLSPWAINRDKNMWGADAHEFKPDRWIDTDTTRQRRPNNSGDSISNFSFMTFLHGPRSCIGQGFAKAELRFLVAAFVAHFDMRMADPNEKVVSYGVVAVKPKDGMNLRLKPLHI